jgi:hypothetical protein
MKRNNSVTRYKEGAIVIFTEDFQEIVENKTRLIKKDEAARIIKVEIEKHTYEGFKIHLWLEFLDDNSRFILREDKSQWMGELFDSLKIVPASEMSEVLYKND